MDPDAFIRALRTYHEAFAEHDPARRLELLAASMAPHAEIWGPKRVFAGHGEISEKIAGFHRNWPSCRLVLATGLNTFENAARIGQQIIGPDGEARATGHALVELADDGRIRRVIPFWEPLPPLPADWPAAFAPGYRSASSIT